ncbi:hypothetical protein QVD17_06459 [Tagetes erecta]|uniref:Uncharacterized protein n=1 Tax=Tagetes erecta TaxID=13708 RepID=A0AAD8LDR7_TARER|nr:hypothetical protein QVD17_06459 [Tagetes erecta]
MLSTVCVSIVAIGSNNAVSTMILYLNMKCSCLHTKGDMVTAPVEVVMLIMEARVVAGEGRGGGDVDDNQVFFITKSVT